MHLPRPQDHTCNKIESNNILLWKGKQEKNYGDLLSSYMRSSAAVLRWNWAWSSFGIDESTSFPLANSILPMWRIAATTLKIASWDRGRDSERMVIPTFMSRSCYLHASVKPIPDPSHLCQQYPSLSLWLDNHEHHLLQPIQSNLIG